MTVDINKSNSNSDKYFKSIQSLIYKYCNLLDKFELIDILVKEAKLILDSEVIVFIYKDYLSYLDMSNYNLTLESLDFLDIRTEFVNHTSINVYLGSSYTQLKSNTDIYGLVECKKENLKDIEKEYLLSIVTLLGKTIENHILYFDNVRSINTYQRISKITYRLSELKDIDILKSSLIMELKDVENIENVSIVLNTDLEDTRILSKIDSYKLEWIKKLKDNYEKEHTHYLVIHSLNDELENSVNSKGIGILIIKDTNIIGYVLIEQTSNTFTNIKILLSVVQYATLIFANALMFKVLTNRVQRDELTKLYNRHYLEENINKSFILDTSGVFVLFDIDNFKKVNDTYGHDIGDSILISVSNIIRKNVRSTDISARWGGEELVIYLSNMTVEDSINVVNRILKEVENSTEPKVTVSAGMSYWENNIESQQDLFKKADLALYQSKHNGKNKLTVGDRSGG